MNKEFEEWWTKKENGINTELDSNLFYPESWVDDAKRLFKECYEAGQQSERDKRRWIPITERLPSTGTLVLVKDFNGQVLMLYYTGEYFRFGVPGNYIKADGVIAWQPLPEA